MLKKQLTENIQMELIHPKHSEEIFRVIDANRDFLSQWLRWPAFTNAPSDFETFARSQQKLYEKRKAMVFIIRFNNEIVGAASFNEIESARRMATLGYWLVEGAQGQGIITTVCQELIRMAFEDLQLGKVQLSAAEFNLPSRKVAERLGMTLEGCISHAENVNGKVLSHAVYGLLKPVGNTR